MKRCNEKVLENTEKKREKEMKEKKERGKKERKVIDVKQKRRK
jgi:hypothetical protein